MAGVTETETTPYNENPFVEENGPVKEFEITTEIHLGLLQSEIKEALGQDVSVVMMGQRHPDSAPTADDPATLYVQAPSDFDGRTVRGTITSHEGQTAQDDDTNANDDLRERLASGEDLDLSDLNAVVRDLLGRHRA